MKPIKKVDAITKKPVNKNKKPARTGFLLRVIKIIPNTAKIITKMKKARRKIEYLLRESISCVLDGASAKLIPDLRSVSS